MKCPARLAVCVLLLGCARYAASAEFSFLELEVYPARTARAGELGLESFTTFVAIGAPYGTRGEEEEKADAEDEEGADQHRLLRTSLGLDWGVRPNLEVGARLDLEKPNGDEVDVAGGRLRSRLLVCAECGGLADVGTYLELEAPRRGPTQFEMTGRLIVSRAIGPAEIRVNPLVSLPIVSDERRTLEFGYAAGLFAPNDRRWKVGLEAFGGIGQIRDVDPSASQQHYLFVAFEMPIARCVIGGGPGAGLTRESQSLVLKLRLDCDL